MVDSGIDIINAINKTAAYDSDDLDREIDKAGDMFDEEYDENVTRPGVGHRSMGSGPETL